MRQFSGPMREVKKAVEAYWSGKSSEAELLKVAAEVRKGSLETIKASGVDLIPRYAPIVPIALRSEI
jgi:5-methyltetrahydropteroyltriglutamate--homocysteine methyltransferase